MSLALPEAEALFGRMLDGAMSDDEIRDILLTLTERGESAQEIAGAAKAMRARMLRVSAPAHAIDVCGTGGDGQHSLNISTAVAIVVAACGVPVAKHGNRAASSKSGGADALEALGLDLALASEKAEETLDEIGIAFLFVQHHHPAMKFVMPIRRAIGRRTIFNLLGPLANPASVSRQLIGIARPDYAPIYREAMELLEMQRVMVAAGEEGLDELSIAGPSLVETLGLADIAASVSPEDAGLPRHSLETIRGGDAQFNAAAIARLLDGERGPYRDAVLLNAAGALIVAGEAASWEEGVEEAAEAIDKGLAKALLACWIDAVS
ncbi:MAG TPA: anthranilate phosphoribosyltransferase [Sphingomonadaceae bacterium]